MLKTYRIEIKPTKEQILKINKTMGTCKFIYNLYLKTNEEKYKLNGVFTSGFTFSKWLNNDFIPNNPTYSWIKESSSKAIKKSIMNAELAYKKFFNKKSQYPKYKKKSDSVGIYFIKDNATDCTIKRHRIKIPTFGFIRIKEYGYIPIESKVKSGTITKIADKYFVNVLVEEEFIGKGKGNHTKGIGVDLGVKEFAFVSDGTSYKNINKSNKIIKLEKKLKREQRALSQKIKNTKLNKTKDGNVFKNLNKNKLRIQKQYYKLSNIRREYVRFVVNSLVKNNPKFIAIEDLNVTGMMKNRYLSKAISKQNFYYFREYLTHKCKKQNIELRVIDRWYPSSKLCSQCGNIKKDLKLSDRVFKCDCGNIIDRDLQASINIRNCEIYKIA